MYELKAVVHHRSPTQRTSRVYVRTRREPSSTPSLSDRGHSPSPLVTLQPVAHASSPVYGPANPYDLTTSLGRKHIERRDCGQFPTPIDKWLQANLAQYHREDPRLMSTHVLCDELSCKVEVEYSPVSLFLLIFLMVIMNSSEFRRKYAIPKRSCLSLTTLRITSSSSRSPCLPTPQSPSAGIRALLPFSTSPMARVSLKVSVRTGGTCSERET